jgi:predicted cupin superfamily sugar epimerase
VNERAAALIERLRLRPHPEGGFYAEVHRAAAAVDPRDGRPLRAALTAIHFLLPAGAVSRWHRVRSEEVWCYLEGAPLELHMLDAATHALSSVVLAPVSAATLPQATVPADCWQAARSLGAYSLAACIVAPGFDFEDFTLMRADDPLRAWLAQQHPALVGY